ncbi:hypothetical protein KSC_086830 [Ktedonobacter sp. SOSP1-52]|uniref:hypothetical protein n=1 Tax=Ktedonobacter sp. SOSP1-52 TaxID=2778366 RepID=UPI0019153CFF|nr:hypothetical protein [Ktedonobacter sp. SOSP1-52]GHO69791.1 hypothetical protein KSC_086830 [Ktedonobacter sp. SOSP1-52]
MMLSSPRKALCLIVIGLTIAIVLLTGLSATAFASSTRTTPWYPQNNQYSSGNGGGINTNNKYYYGTFQGNDGNSGYNWGSNQDNSDNYGNQVIYQGH